MSYQALARKWRPRLFADLVGQEHVLRALVHALDNDRLHHAYLFTGTRGVGKTTIARILAKALNCEDRRVLDALRRVRRLPRHRRRAFRRPARGRRRLADQDRGHPRPARQRAVLAGAGPLQGVPDRRGAHAVAAFLQRLLKTLEEPPPHVKFLLATTDPQNLPVTVLSRCLQFNLKRLPASLIRERLRLVAESRGIWNSRDPRWTCWHVRPTAACAMR
jgi:DNA polymerase III subunit gamma/tau